MYLVFLIIWIIFNEKFNLEILLFGLVISAVVFAFVCRFMDYSVKKELNFYRCKGPVKIHPIFIFFVSLDYFYQFLKLHMLFPGTTPDRLSDIQDYGLPASVQLLE